MKTKITFILLMISTLTFVGCVKPVEDEDSASSSKHLYVASGACYSGSGITTFTNATASNQVFRINLASGERELISDYYASPSNTGDSPVSIVDDGDHLLIALENTTTTSLRRIERVNKEDGRDRATYTSNTAALTTTASHVLRNMIRLNDDYLLISKSIAAEKTASGTQRLVVGANPWLNMSSPASSCTASATLISDVKQLSNGLLAFSHAAASNARVGFVASTGYSVAGDCKTAVNSPSPTNSFPTSMVYDKANHILLVAYQGSTTNANINTLQAYALTEGVGTVSVGAANEIYDANEFGSTYDYLLFGVSAMVLDQDTHMLYVAKPITTATTASGYQIDQFYYDASKVGVDNSHVLTRVGTFYDYGVDTKCISSMIIAN